MLKPGTKYKVREDLSPERYELLEEWGIYPGQIVTFKSHDSTPMLFRIEESWYIYSFKDVQDYSFEENLKKILE